MALTTVPASLSATALTLTTAAQPNITSVGTLTGLTVSGNIAGTLTTAAQTNITSLGTLTALTVDDITIDGSTISDAADFTIDAGGDIILDAGGADIILKDDGTQFGKIYKGGGSDLVIESSIADKDIIFTGTDASSPITALTLNMSGAGEAIFNAGATFGGGLIVSGTISISGDNEDLIISSNDYENVFIGNRGASGTNLDKGYFRMKSEGTNTVVIDTAGNSFFNGGNIGIGTASPGAALDIETAGNTADGTYYSTITINNTGSSTYSRLRFDRSGSERWGVGLRNDDKFHIAKFFNTANDDTFVIDSSGNVGINQPSPAAKLDIKGDTTTYGGMAKIYLTDTASNSESRNWAIGNGGSGFGHFTIGRSVSKNGDPMATGTHVVPFMIDHEDNVGIGMAPVPSMGAPLQIQSSTGYVGIRLNGTGSYAHVWDLYASKNGNNDKIFGVYDRNNNAYRLAVVNDGNVGIGTTEPMTLSGNAAPGLTIASNGPYILLKDANNANQVTYISNNTGVLQFGKVNDNGSTSKTEFMRITAGGKVGIGEGNPIAPLSIEATSTNTANHLLHIYRPDGLTHNGEPYSSILIQNQETSAGYQYDGVTIMASYQAHYRFQVGNTGSWGGSGAKRWQLRVGVGNAVDQMSIYSWTAGGNNGGNEVVAWDTAGTQTNYVTSGNYVLRLKSQNGADLGIGPLNTSYTHFIIQNSTANTFYFGQRCEASGGFHTYSDERLKKEITPISDALTKVKKMNGVTFKWIDPENRGSADTGKQFGVTAQNMLEVDSELPTLNKDPLYNVKEDVSESDEYYTMDYSRITPFLIEAIKEQQAQIEALQAEVKALKGE